MKELMLNQARQLTKLGNVAAEKLYPVHHAENSPDLALAREHGPEHFPRSLRILIDAGNLSQPSGEHIFQLRAEIQFVLLGKLEQSHHLHRIFLKKIATIGVELAVAN